MKCFEINGFNSNVTVNSVATALLQHLFLLEKFPKNHDKMLELVVSCIEDYNVKKRPKIQLVLFIHNIESENLRHPSFYHILSKLCENSSTRLVASVDHFNACSLSFPQNLFSSFVWLRNTTFQPYLEEASFEAFEGVSTSKEDNLNGALMTLTSVPPNSKKAYFVLAKHFLSSEEQVSAEGWVELCNREGFFCNKVELKNFVKEFADHDMIKQKGQKYSLPFDADALQKMIARLEILIKK